jgi:protein phosphatase
MIPRIRTGSGSGVKLLKLEKEKVTMGIFMRERQKTLQIDSAALTDRGRQREVNEDYVFHQSAQTPQHEPVGLFMVCDGLGGHQAGEIASRMAVETITAELSDLFLFHDSANGNGTRPSSRTLNEEIERAVKKANTQLRTYANSHPKAANLGTTVTLALLFGEFVYLANTGDGRAYAWRAGRLTRITQDHSLAAELARQGVIEDDQIAGHARSNVLTRAVGIKDEVEVDLFDWILQPGDKLLLCSDGLWKAFPDTNELAQLLASAQTSAELCQQLVAQAKERDGSDNISAVVITMNETEC